MTVTPIAQTTSAPATFEIGADGICQPMSKAPSSLRRFRLRRPYRLYRFLSDLDDLVDSVKSDRDRLRIAAVLVRHLLTESSWIAEACPDPDPDLGWSVHFLYDEPGYPFTVQTVSWVPGEGSPVHNHATWSVVAIVGDEQSGQEENTFWTRGDKGDRKGHADVVQTGQQILNPGDILTLMPEAIHSVKAISSTTTPQPTRTFNVYGLTDMERRYEFDPVNQSCKNF